MTCFVNPTARLYSTTPEQDPAKADKITKIQRDLDDTTEVLVRHKHNAVFAVTRLKLLCFRSISNDMKTLCVVHGCLFSQIFSLSLKERCLVAPVASVANSCKHTSHFDCCAYLVCCP